jgi:glycine C-acetyltransferase
MFRQELKKLEEQGLLRNLREVGSAQGARIILDGKEVINLCSNNYLGLADHPALKEAATDAIKKYGVGTSASRLISGTTTLHRKLEEKIASFKGTEAALVFNSGYTANVGIISAMVGRGDIIFGDKLNHASIVDGCILSGAQLKRYPHCDTAALEKMLQENNGVRRLIVTDTVFSMDGDIAPLPELVKLAKKYNCMLMVDEAHATGVLGENGKGAVEHFNINEKDIIHMGTLSKAVGTFGGYAAGSGELIKLLYNKSRAFVYTTALPASVIAASIVAFDVIKNEPGLRKQLWDNVRFFDKNSSTQIIPVLIGDNKKALKISTRLLDEGVFIQAIRPPTVPKGQARLRITVMATHTREDLQTALDKIRKVMSNEA